jgi:L-lysine 6-transaminase
MTQGAKVHDTLARYQLADGLPIVFDLERSHGCWLTDARTGEDYLDFFTCFATWPIGYNHPGMDEKAFRAELDLAARNNPSNSDLYTESMARFVEAFGSRVTPSGYPHHFWVAGGALAVENTLKVAFDWKARRSGTDGEDQVIVHFREAFHGRSGYTMSLTNTDPNKTALFPKFRWPRISNPKIVFRDDGGIQNDVAADERRAVREIEAAFGEHGSRVAAIIIEPIQCEGGDNHFRREFFSELRRLADEHEALLIFDEVQTGFFSSGKAWMWQHHGVRPDIVAFGKKTQVCGLYASERVDDVPDNVFRRAGRINSTWGGNLTDMVRCRRFIDIILGEKLHENIARIGAQFVAGLRAICAERGGIQSPRGVGSIVACDLESTALRDQFVRNLRASKLLVLNAGSRTVRFRMPFVAGEREVAVALERIRACLPAGVRA